MLLTTLTCVYTYIYRRTTSFGIEPGSTTWGLLRLVSHPCVPDA